MARFWTIGALDKEKEEAERNASLLSAVNIAKGGALFVAKNTPGVSLVVNGGQSAYKEYEKGGDAVDVAVAAVGLNPVQEAVTNKETSLFSKIGHGIVEGFKWFFNVATLGMGSSLFSAATGPASSVINEGEKMIVKNRVADMFHTTDEKQLEELYKQLDANRNGKLSNLEVDVAEGLLDLNKDGTVSKEEIAQLGGVQKAAAYVRSKNEVIHDDILHSEDKLKSNLIRALGKAGEKVVDERWSELDYNRDGRVDSAEYHRAVDGLDTDKDGLISTSELKEKAGNDGNALFNWIAQNNQDR